MSVITFNSVVIMELSTISSSTSAVSKESALVTSTGTLTSSESMTKHHTSLIIILSVLIALTIISLIMVAIVSWHLFRKRRTTYTLTKPTPLPPHVHPPSIPTRVFIVTDKNSEAIRRLCYHLTDYDIDYIYYQYVENDRHDGPGQLGIGVWTEKSFNESDMVLLVCNKGFNNVWKNGTESISNGQDPYTAQIISTTKHLFHGLLSGNNLSKFAVVLLQESDQCYIPDVLKNIKSFSVVDYEALARYILQVPEFIPPNHHR